jgi:hypothetical protein
MDYLFERAFSESSIIRELCKARIKLAKRRHERAFLHNIRKDHKAAHELGPQNWENIPLDIFPARRNWHRFRPVASKRGTRPSLDINVDALFRATLKLRKQEPNAAWVKNLNRVVARLRRRVLKTKRFSFSRPSITPLVKNTSLHEYRALVVFRLEDKIIDCLTAKYLRESFDELLSDSCLAFRCRQGSKAPPTIHDALARIMEVRTQVRRRDIFVAECDIRGFFDCVSHKLVLSSFEDLVGVARKNNSFFDIDARAKEILAAYLRAFSYSRDVYGSRDAKAQLKSVDSKGYYKWPREDLKALYRGKNLRAIGIPQGGALSCFIANIVLRSADQAIESVRQQSRDLLYLRYCDDMILISSTLGACNRAFENYVHALKKLRLPVHPPKSLSAYSTRKAKLKFWNGKSNRPYRWGTSRDGGMPWIQFVGYQIRYDGLVRVRPKSLKKEFKKVSNASSEMLRAIHPSHIGQIRKTRQQIRHRFRTRLISMAVGRRKLGPPIDGPLPMCWTNGFRGLLKVRFVIHPLKALDRHREYQIRRVDRALAALTLPKVANRKTNAYPYYGLPFSYLGQFGALKRILKT